MHSFEVSLGYESVDLELHFQHEALLGYESVDRSTFSMKRG